LSRRLGRKIIPNLTLGNTSPSTPPPTNPPNSLPTPIKVKILEYYLQGYDHNKTLYLINGFSHGFPLEFEGPREPSFCFNLKSALDNPAVVRDKLQKELVENRVAGPFPEPPFLNLKISPLGLVPKKSMGSWSLIHHLSMPVFQMRQQLYSTQA
jgi:hypothetical protein